MLKKIILMSQDQQTQLQEKVKALEDLLSVEIVPMLVKKSAPIGHVKTILFLIFLGVLLALNPYETIWLSLQEHLLVLALSILGLLVASHFLAQSSLIQRILTNDNDEIEMVQRRAEYEFFKSGLHQTTKRNAILLFISRMEQRAHIVVDTGLDGRVNAEQRQLILEPLVKNLKKQKYFEAFAGALGVLEQLLDKSTGSHTSELSDEITIKD